MPNNVAYSHETVVLEAETFSGCEFRDCRLIYAGGEPATRASSTPSGTPL